MGAVYKGIPGGQYRRSPSVSPSESCRGRRGYRGGSLGEGSLQSRCYDRVA